MKISQEYYKRFAKENLNYNSLTENIQWVSRKPEGTRRQQIPSRKAARTRRSPMDENENQ